MSDPYKWASTEPLVTAGYPVDVAERAVFMASWLLWALSGRTLHSEGTRIDTWEMKPGGRSQIKLRYRPVLEVTRIDFYSPWTDTLMSTAASGNPLVAGESFVLIGNTIDIRRLPFPVYVEPYIHTAPTHAPMDGRGPQVIATTTYEVGSNLPPNTHVTVLKLAEEYCRAATGKGCNLPERVTSITRQGMSWTLLDPGDFLDKGLTGVIGIDTWLTAVNPRHARSQARLFDPAMPKLLSSTWALVPTSQIANGNGTTTFYGHGSPSVITIAGAVAGDSYVDLDTGKSYAAGGS